MKRYLSRLSLSGLLATGMGLLWLASAAEAGQPILKGYADYEAFCSQVRSIGESEFAALKSLGRTLGGREVYLLQIGTGKQDDKPALLIVGSVHPPHLLGSELAVRLARRLVDQAGSDESVRKLLERVTFYVIPRPSPDACEAFSRRPYLERIGNQRRSESYDADVDQPEPEDLNGDGLITMIRVEDAAGPYMPHADDARVLVRADPQRNEHGRYNLYVEGRHRDGDEPSGEGRLGGVAFNRNFPFRYPYYQPSAGPHAVSEVETRAVADFALDHPNIAVVLTFTPEDNLMQPWKPDPAAESQRIKTTVLSADVPYFRHLAELYREIHGGKDPPPSPQGQGSFSEWAYFHYGRWSLACRGWWIPQVEVKKKKVASTKDESEPKQPAPEPEKKIGPKTGKLRRGNVEDQAKEAPSQRGADDLNALRWFAREKIDGFADWKPIAHPDFPGRKVEVGGFKPFVRLNPPARELEPLADKHWRFLQRLVELLPQVTIRETKAESLGGGVWRVTAVVVNQGYLPTMSRMGSTAREPYPLQIKIELPKGASLIVGNTRRQLPLLAGNGGKAEQTWLVRIAQAKPVSLRLRVWSPSVGADAKTVELASKPTKEENP